MPMFDVSKSNGVSFSELHNWHKSQVKFYLTSYLGHTFLAQDLVFPYRRWGRTVCPSYFHRLSLAAALITILPPFWLQHHRICWAPPREGSCPSQHHRLLCIFRIHYSLLGFIHQHDSIYFLSSRNLPTFLIYWWILY